MTIREFIGEDQGTVKPKPLTETFIAAEGSLMVEIEGIHGFPYSTGNHTRYMPEALKNTLTWTHPYNKPLILHHNTKNGKVIGRIIEVECIENSRCTNSPALKFLVNVSDEDAKKAVQDGRLDTVSIGINATDVRCSICGHQIDDGDCCEHERGYVYETQNFFVVKSNKNITESLEEGTQKLNKTDDTQKELEESNTKLKQQVDEIQKEKKALEDSAAESKLLREGLETELADTKVILKETLIQQLQYMRLAIGKDELDKEKVSSRSEESLRDSIADLTEEFQSKITSKKDKLEESLPPPDSLKNPAVVDEEKNSKKDLKESDEGNIDLKAGFENIFNAMLSLHK